MTSKRFLGSYLIAILIFLCLWQSVSLLTSSAIIPKPLELFIYLRKIFYQHQLALHLWISMIRILISICVSTLLSYILLFFVYKYKKSAHIINTFINCFYPIPKVVLLPIFIIILGIGNLSKILLIVSVLFFQIYITLRDGLKILPKNWQYILLAQGASSSQLFFKLVLPSSLPALFSILKVSLGSALNLLFISETYATEYGLGYYIMLSLGRMNYLGVFSGITMMALISLIFFYILSLLNKRFCFWAKHQE